MRRGGIRRRARHVDSRCKKDSSSSHPVALVIACAPLICDHSRSRLVAPDPRPQSAFVKGLHVRMKTRHIGTAALFAALSLTVPAVVRAGGPPANAAVASSNIHIDNFGRVDERLYRGAQPEGRDYTDLACRRPGRRSRSSWAS
jgi:hypothetical protein